MRTLKKLLVAVLCICLFASVFTVSAKDVEYAPYSGYEYNADRESVAAPATYIFQNLITYEDMGLDKPLTNPTDMFWSGSTLYVLDADNSRIICLDENLKAVGLLENFVDEKGETYNFAGAKGLAVTKDGTIYIADTVNLRVLVTDSSCVVKDVIGKPNTTLVGYDYTFDVSKILVSTQGSVYVTAGSVNNGAFVFDENHEFTYFFGRSTVQRTAEVLLNYAEAKAELGEITNTDWNNTIGELRRRAGFQEKAGVTSSLPTTVDPYLQETFYPNVTDPVILEIRRERTIELVYEGFREDDLRRWRCGKNFERVPWTGIHVPALNVQFAINDEAPLDFYVTYDAYDDVPSYAQNKYVPVLPEDSTEQGLRLDVNPQGGWDLRYELAIKRKWYNDDRQYLDPIPAVVIREYASRGYKLDQNPGW